jgi:hypothetical protein
MERLSRSLALLCVGGLLGAGLFARLGAAQEDIRPATGYTFWSTASDNTKLAYMYGYDDAEEMYRVVLDEGAKPLCTEAGKQWIADFNRKFPMPKATIGQTKAGLDEFYRDWKNQRIGLWKALNVVRLQIAGRPQTEIDEQIRKLRELDSKSN